MTNFLDSLPDVPGRPEGVRHLAHRLGGAAEALDGQGSRLRSIVGSLVGDGWRSPAAERFASLSSTIAGDLQAAGETYRAAAGVLSRYASALELAQQARAAAQRQLDQAKVEAGLVDVALPMLSGVEDFNPAVRQAHAQADEALRFAGQTAAGARAALETLAGVPVHAPGRVVKSAGTAQHWYERGLGFGQDFGEGLYEGLKAQAMMGWNASVGHLLVDPKGYRRFLQEQGDAGDLAGKHPEDFARSLIDWNDWTSGHPGRASGELAALVATTAGLSFVDAGLAGAPAVAENTSQRALIRLPTSQSWGRPGTLTEHFQGHGADFGSLSEDDYASQASAFLQSSQVRGLPTKIDSRGVIRIYDPAMNAFGSFNPNGTARTFYRPDPNVHGLTTNWEYWARQAGSDPWTGLEP